MNILNECLKALQKCIVGHACDWLLFGKGGTFLAYAILKKFILSAAVNRVQFALKMMSKIKLAE